MTPETSPSILTTDDKTEIKSRTQAALEWAQRQHKGEIHNLGRRFKLLGTMAGLQVAGFSELILLMISRVPGAPEIIEKWGDFVSQSPENTLTGAVIPVLAGAIIGNRLGTNSALLKDGPKREQALKEIGERYEIEVAGSNASIPAQITKRREIANRNT